jgi:hypothetical protein
MSQRETLTSVGDPHIISLVGPLAHVLYIQIIQKIGGMPAFAKGEAVHMDYFHASADQNV